MTINGLSQNLFYWNGQDTDGVAGLTPSDVKFGALPSPNYRLTLLDFNNGIHSVDGTNTIVPGSKIAPLARMVRCISICYLRCKITMATSHVTRRWTVFDRDPLENPRSARLAARVLFSARLDRRFRPKTMLPTHGSSSNSICRAISIKTASSTPPTTSCGATPKAKPAPAFQPTATPIRSSTKPTTTSGANFGLRSQIIVNTGSSTGSSQNLASSGVP